MGSTSCPSSEELGRFVVGDLDVRSFARIEAHVEGCPTCEQALQALDVTTDALVSALRGPLCSNSEKVPPELLTLAHSALGAVPTREWSVGELPRRVGKFELLEELGAGSFGTVFRAFDRELEREVAVKILRAGGLAGVEDIERFVREARSVLAKHPGIVSLCEAGGRGSLLLVEEPVRGVTLAERSSPGHDSRDAAISSRRSRGSSAPHRLWLSIAM